MPKHFLYSKIKIYGGLLQHLFGRYCAVHTIKKKDKKRIFPGMVTYFLHLSTKLRQKRTKRDGFSDEHTQTAVPTAKPFFLFSTKV